MLILTVNCQSLKTDGSLGARLIRSLLCPEVAVRQFVKRFSIGSIDFRLSLQALDRPQYAFGVRQAVYLAKKLNHPKVSVIEFGVAAGDGLLTLERYAAEFGKREGVEVEVYGFDLGSGLPPTVDYRDLPYVWRRGAYQMDIDGLRKRLTTAKLLLGNVQDTVLDFIKTAHAPIGFISFDLDYYSSTTAALRLFETSDQGLLPRVLCYFDDVLSDGHQLHCEEVGELLAIREFNRNAKGQYVLSPIGMGHSYIIFPALWLHQTWVYHRFQHGEYNEYIGE